MKRIIAAANYQCCSAAYWIAANATEVIAAPSSVLGSIGIFTIHEDLSKALDQVGVNLTYISAGKFKMDGNESEPLSDSARARLQKQVDTAFDRFVGDVAAGRRVSAAKVRADFGQGATLSADEALAAGMIDRIETIDEIRHERCSCRVSQNAAVTNAVRVGSFSDSSETLQARV